MTSIEIMNFSFPGYDFRDKGAGSLDLTCSAGSVLNSLGLAANR